MVGRCEAFHYAGSGVARQRVRMAAWSASLAPDGTGAVRQLAPLYRPAGLGGFVVGHDAMVI